VLLLQAGVLVLRPGPAAPHPGRVASRAFPRALLVAVLAAGAVLLLAVALRSTPARVAAVLASLVAAAWLRPRRLLPPAFAAAQPNRQIAADVARERQYRPDLRMAFCSDPTRVRRDVLLYVRLAAFAECDLWSPGRLREPFLSPRHTCPGRLLPRGPPLPRGGPVPIPSRECPHPRRLVSIREAGEIVLGANFPTTDPEAERKRKRDYRKAIQRERAELEASKRAESP